MKIHMICKYAHSSIVFIDDKKDLPMIIVAVLFDGSDCPQYKLQWVNAGTVQELWVSEWRITEHRP